MDSEIFSTTLENRVVVLRTAADVVRFSFIVQNSITYLDLELCQNSMVSNNVGTTCYSCTWKSFINTEEKCRKFLTPSRNLHYALHLDLPKGREYGLKNVPESITIDRCNSIPHVARIIPSCGFEASIVSNSIEEALKINIPKLTILEWILKFPFSEVPLLQKLKRRTVNKFIDCFYPEITDYGLFTGFIQQFDVFGWMTKNDNPEILEYLLYHTRRLGRTDLEEDDGTIEDLLGDCFDRLYFSNIGPFFKYVDVARFTSDDYRMFWNNISTWRPQLTEILLEEAEKLIERDRIDHIVQIIWMYIASCRYRCTEAVSEALRLLWNSFIDACIIFEEFETVFGKAFETEFLEDIYIFYIEAVGEFHECVEPRSLKHLSRATIRRILCENKYWIPEGISKTGLPKHLQSFLNLEKQFTTIVEFES